MVCLLFDLSESISLLTLLIAGDYEKAVASSNSAEAITSVLYPNDHTTCTYFYAVRKEKSIVYNLPFAL